MTHTYQVSGMTCNGCAATVQKTLSAVPHIQAVNISLPAKQATLTMDRHVPVSNLQQALQQAAGTKYTIVEAASEPVPATLEPEPAPAGWLAYKPLLLVFAFITGITLLAEATAGSFELMRWMRHFMAAFFLCFSFFKFLDLRGFADSYRTYDLLARYWPDWGFVYAFVELLLGIAYFVAFRPVLTNAIAFITMAVSMIGVLQSVLRKRKIRCACLGTVFNLPMSTVTIVEDGLMLVMSAGMLIAYL